MRALFYTHLEYMKVLCCDEHAEGLKGELLVY